jgi:hypothetical protein
MNLLDEILKGLSDEQYELVTKDGALVAIKDPERTLYSNAKLNGDKRNVNKHSNFEEDEYYVKHNDCVFVVGHRIEDTYIQLAYYDDDENPLQDMFHAVMKFMNIAPTEKQHLHFPKCPFTKSNPLRIDIKALVPQHKSY